MDPLLSKKSKANVFLDKLGKKQLSLFRKCQIKHYDLQEETGLEVLNKWTPETYDEGMENKSFKECPFNVLEGFHAVNNMPLDFMHDFLEGISIKKNMFYFFSIQKTISHLENFLLCLTFIVFNIVFKWFLKLMH